MATRVTALEPTHNVKDFDCGNEDLNTFLRSTASQHQRKYVSKTFVLTDDDAPTVVMGFYALSVRKMTPRSALPPQMAKRMPHEVPGLSLARLAVRRDLRGHHHGEYLLYHALDKAAHAADEIGGFALFVDAKDVAGAAFYKKYGFVQFPDDPLTLCLPFHLVQR